MKIIESVQEMRSICKENKLKLSGFVPTMGALHDGHKSLCVASKANNEITIVSIFLNPTQFNNPKDLEKYPSNLEHDIKILDELEIDYLFLPKYQDIYHDNYNYQIHETALSSIMEGEHRPGHFNGVLTIVLKLCNIIQSTNMYLGEKDYQQALLIREMFSALFVDTIVNICPTIRDEYGLALSSRNALLTPEELNTARILNQNLRSSHSIDEIINQLEKNKLMVEYITDYKNRRFAAVKIGSVRLIDNIEIALMT